MGWERSRHNQVRIVAISTIILAILVGTLAGLVLGPIRGALRSRDRKEIDIRNEMTRGEILSFFAHAQQIATQLPNRARIRQELVAYLQGARTLDEYRALAGPTIRDSMEWNPEILGVARMTPGGTIVVQEGLSGDEAFPLDGSDTRVLPGFFTVAGRRALLVRVEIVDPAYGHAGWDIVAVGVDALIRRLEATSSVSDGVILFLSKSNGNDLYLSAASPEAENSEILTSPRETITGDDGQEVARFVVSYRGEEYYGAEYPLHDEWFLTVFNAATAVHRETSRTITLIVLLVAGVGVLALSLEGVALGMLTRRTIAETKELSALVTERTRELRNALEQKQILMREVHHRIKNDMLLVQSLISLQIEQNQDAAPAEVLKNTQGAITLMQRIYESLYHQEEFGTVAIQPVLTGLLEEDIQAITSADDLSISTDIEDLVLPRKIAVPIGVIANELTINSIKYGRSTGATLAVHFELGRHDGSLRFSIADNGPGFPDAILGGSYGYGLSMAEALIRQFYGRFRIYNDNGAHVVATIPSAALGRPS